MRFRPRRLAAALVAGALAVTLAACSANDSLADQYREGSNKGYIGADGVPIVETPPAERSDPIVFTGMSDSGETVTNEDYAGQVLVVNFWYAACGPCIVEAPRLEKSYEDLQGENVSFLGINTYDQAPTAASFAKDNGISYPSLLAVDDSKLKLSFASATPLTATPTTLVLDKQGRVAARIVGELGDASILTTLVRDALKEGS